MKKIFLMLILVLFGSSCIGSGGGLVWDQSALYELKVNEDKIYYFQHPLEAEVSEENGSGYVEFDGCKANFDHTIGRQADEFVDLKVRRENGKRYEAWYVDNDLILYAGFIEKADYVFWIYEDGGDVSRCIDLVNNLTESFISDPIYFNDRFSFKSGLLYDYKLEYLPSGEGILMKKWIGDNICEDEFGNEYECGYKVEISVYGFKNLMEYKDVYEYINEKYSGYNAEFSDPGVFVDEGSDEDAIRHYFVMNDNSDIIVEAYMKVPSFNYGEHKEEFDEFVKTIEVF